MDTSHDGSVYTECEEASSSELAQEASPTNKGKNNMPAK